MSTRALKHQKLMVKACAKDGQTIPVLRGAYRDATGVYHDMVTFTVRGLDVLKRDLFPTFFQAAGLMNLAAGDNHDVLFLPGDTLSDVREGDTLAISGWLYIATLVKPFIETDVLVLRYVYMKRERVVG